MGTLKNKLFSLLAILMLSAVAVTAVPAQTQSLTATETQVRKQLVKLPWTGVFDNLEFKVDGDTVTLYGQVVRPTTRKDAERRVARVAGVNRVINNIEVLPLSPADDRIREQAYSAIYNQAGLYRYLLGANPSLRIIVSRGHITLKGIVANETDARLAWFAANSVPLTFSVKNDLRTEKGRRL